MQHNLRRSGALRCRVVMLVALLAAILALPATSSADLVPGASVTVCQVTGGASAPNYAQVAVAVDQVAAYLNQFPGSFVGTCPSSSPPSSGGGSGTPNAAVTVCHVTGNATTPYTEVTIAADQVAAYLNQNAGSFVGACPNSGSSSGSGSGGTPVPNGSLAVCKVTGSASALNYAQVVVTVDQLAAYLNRNAGFVGACPSAGDPNGNPGALPTGFVTICKVTGNASTPYTALTVAADRVGAYLNQAGTIAPAPAGGCPTSVPVGAGSETPGSTPSTVTSGSSTTVAVNTTPNTVVTATGAGVNAKTKSDTKGRAVVKIKPKRRGIVTIRGAGGKVIKRVGVAGARTSGKSLTG